MTDQEKVQQLREALRLMLDNAPTFMGTIRCGYCYAGASHTAGCVVRTAQEALRDTAPETAELRVL